MSNDTTIAPSVETLLEIWGGVPSYRVMPAFAEPHEIAEAQAVLRSLLDDPDPSFTEYGRNEGAARLRWMAVVDARCARFADVADLLEQQPPTTRLVLGWSIQ